MAGNDLLEIEKFEVFLDEKVKLKDLGTLKFFLGLKVARSSEGIFLNQRGYAPLVKRQWLLNF